MANSSFIKPATYINLTESQIYEWRKSTYNDLNIRHNFTDSQMKLLKSYPLPSKEELLTEISEQIKHEKIVGNLSKKKDNIIYIDSSTLCKIAIPTIIKSIFHKYPDRRNLNNIIVFSNISKVENLYKFIKHYKDVNYNTLTFNMDLLTKKIPFRMKNIIILTTNLIFDNKCLIEHEIEYLHNFGDWRQTSIKNEINDNAQISIMNYVLMFFKQTDGIIVSHDKKMCEKIKKLMVNLPNLKILESIDM